MQLVTVREFAKLRYRTDEPTKAQLNTVAAMCKRGGIKYAQKVGKSWLIDVEKELEGCFTR